MKHYYTLWKGSVYEDEATLLNDENVYKTRRNAFRRAKELANTLFIGSGFFILVRRVALHDPMCTEWKFEPTRKEN